MGNSAELHYKDFFKSEDLATKKITLETTVDFSKDIDQALVDVVEVEEQLKQLVQSLFFDETEVLLECVKLGVIHRTDHNINSLRHRLFCLTMWIDRRVKS